MLRLTTRRLPSRAVSPVIRAVTCTNGYIVPQAVSSRLSTRDNALRTASLLAPPLRTHSRGFASSRVTTYQNGHQFHKLLKKTHGEGYAEQVIDTRKLLGALRDTVSLRGLKPSASRSIEYKAGLRAISQLAGADGGKSKPSLTIGEIEGLLTKENGVTWRLIHELVDYGFSTELESLDEAQRAEVRFNRVHGFGIVRSKDFVRHGARTLDDLLGSTDKEYGRRVSDAQKLALRYHAEMEVMIPREEVDEFHKLILEAMRKREPTLQFEFMGSYRRGEPVSSDIDMVVWHRSYTTRDPDAKIRRGVDPASLMGRVLEGMMNAGLLRPDKIFSQGEKKTLALTRLPHPTALHRQIDIRLCPTDSLAYMLLGNTGDDALMRLLRWKAGDQGWMLNEYGMGKRADEKTRESANPQSARIPNPAPTPTAATIIKGTEIPAKTEQQIFHKLGVPYLEPSQRSYARYSKSRFWAKPNTAAWDGQ